MSQRGLTWPPDDTPWCSLLVERFREWRELTGGNWQEFVTMLDDSSHEE